MIEFSILCLDRFNKTGELDKILPYVDSLHLDIMDGDFVPNYSMSVEKINQFCVPIPKHVHIMSFHPEKYIENLEKANSISFHIEAVSDPKIIVDLIHEKNMRAGICLNPGTPIESILPFLDVLDRVIVMAVKPGFSGQKYIEGTYKKVKQLRSYSQDIEIVVDGGMHEDTIREVISYGANACVVCSVIVKADDYQTKIASLKQSILVGEVASEYIHRRDLNEK